MNRTARIYVAGGQTLVGAALLELLRSAGYCNLVGTPPDEPDLTVAGQVEDFFGEARPEYVFLVAGKSGGIDLNRQRPAELMLDNLLIAAHVIHQAYCHRVRKLLYLASSCCYPKHAPQPLRVESLMTGRLEPTSAAYATAKLAGWQLCEAYRQQYGIHFVTAFPANPFGPHDDFSPESGHVIPALMRRAHEAKVRGEPVLPIWGTGTPRREFIYSRDLADACLFVMHSYDGPEPINLGGAVDLSIAEVAEGVAELVGYRGRLHFDTSKADGMPFKGLDSSRLRELGWGPSTDFRVALAETYAWFQKELQIADCRLQIADNSSDRQPGLCNRKLARMNGLQVADDSSNLQSAICNLQSERLYRSLYRIRRVEEEVARIYPADKIKSPVHLSIGQEAISVGICEALAPHDVVFGTYRGHALYLAKGGDLKAMIAELYGKATGCTKGKGGSMHLIDAGHGMMGTSAVVGTTIANAVGYAYGLHYRRQDAIVASFLGDGATEEGVFAESLNFAVLKRLPILFVCENNQYAIHTHQSRRQGTPAICARARAYGLPAERIDGNDFLHLCERAKEVVSRIRAGEGPWFFEILTYRWKEHVGPNEDYHLGYRTEEEAAPWIAGDPVRRLGAAIGPSARARLEIEVEEEITAAFAFAEASPFPQPKDLFSGVFKEDEDGDQIAECRLQNADCQAGSAI